MPEQSEQPERQEVPVPPPPAAPPVQPPPSAELSDYEFTMTEVGDEFDELPDE
ncbi:hypothetical protein [Streptomyces kebangsaanensis]|uniref:hypothetical protein n=1 Tax=Streptomyces kebangsaanensis TaxID=864058 RepID=UPI000A625E79|nr:hypothetical protein [Streptomyces kebangsaanensis]